jgi:Arc/MetJ-type ribon-helix-helix transcriptional regulator
MLNDLEQGYEETRVKLVIDLPDPLVGRIKEAVQESRYENARVFVTNAIENQLELEEYGDNEFKTLDEAIEEFDTSEPSAPEKSDEEDAEQEPKGVLTDGLGRKEYDTVPTVPPPGLERLDDGPLWGQYNRVFPAKIVVRRLANMVQGQNESGSPSGDGLRWIELDHFQDDAAQLARNYGLTIREFDQKKSRGRGEKVASGLPTGDDPDKSKDRFETHFIGYSDRNHNLTGAPPHLHFVDISDEDVSRIGITDAGLAFAELHNPLLDDGPDADEPLSAEERSFYLDHSKENLDGEYAAMVKAALAVNDGNNRPTSLTEHIAELNTDWSQSQADTMRSGLVSRMYELGLISRERVGQRGIAYNLTETGESLLDDTEVISA